MGRGNSGIGAGGGSGGGIGTTDFPEAFAPGKDFRAVGGVDHNARTVSRTTQREWDQFTAPFSVGVTAADDADVMGRRTFSIAPNGRGDYVVGYFRTCNSYFINETLYNPNNDGKTISQMFSRKQDRQTVRTMDKLISNHTTQADASYTRFSSSAAIQATFGFSAADMKTLANVKNMTPSELRRFNKAIVNAKAGSYSKAYTSTSGNRTLNAFSSNIFERRINVPKGTNAYAPRQNAQESEVIFGRGLRTRLAGVSVSSDGHIVLHEVFEGYN